MRTILLNSLFSNDWLKCLFYTDREREDILFFTGTFTFCFYLEDYMLRRREELVGYS